MSGGSTVLLALALPLSAAALTALLGRRPNLREASTLLHAGALFVVVATLLPQVLDGARPGVALVELFPGIRLAFEVEPLGMLFALVASGLWFVTTNYSIGYMRGHGEEHQTRFFACFAVAIFAVMGVAMAANMLTLFVFYELLTISTYPLVTHHGDAQAKAGGRLYLVILLMTSVAFLLFAVIWTWLLAGTLDFRPGGILAGKVGDSRLVLLLLLYAFGTGKAALMPFHRWLPAAMVAPTPVSALLHAVAVVKAGVFTVLKVVIYIFGIDLLAGSAAGAWLGYVAGATMLCASLVALTKDNLKARLAYSTISQLAYVVLGASLANEWGIIGGGMHIAMHAFGKITLFFCAGAIQVAAHKTEVSELRGIGRAMPVTTFAFLLGALSITGLPPLGGAWSKWFLILGVADRHQVVLLGLLAVSSLLNLAYLLPIPIRGFFSEPDLGAFPRLHEAPLFCVVPLCLTAAGSVALFFWADEIRRLLLPLAGH